jgi:hypothetical protein
MTGEGASSGLDDALRAGVSEPQRDLGPAASSGSEAQMDTQLSPNPLSANWRLFCGVIIAGAALKELARIAARPLAIVLKRPSLVGTMVIGALLKDAVGGIGRSAMGK